MRLHSSSAAKAALTSTAVITALLVPTAGSATAATTPTQAVGTTAESAAASFDATCRSHSRTYVLKNYYRGPAKYTLRCGTSTWGWKHIKARHGWNSTMDRKINAAFWSGSPNGRGGFSTYTAQCPSVEKFRTIIGTPAGGSDLLTAYNVSTRAAAARC